MVGCDSSVGLAGCIVLVRLGSAGWSGGQCWFGWVSVVWLVGCGGGLLDCWVLSLGLVVESGPGLAGWFCSVGCAGSVGRSVGL